MLKGLPPLLTPDALHALASMGHGDEVALVDANFPAARVAAQGGARWICVPGATTPALLQAVLQLLPLDDFGPERAWSMQVVGDPAAVPMPVAEMHHLLEAAGEPQAVPLERFAFYERCHQAFVLLQTGDNRPYANLLLRKGVVGRA